MAALKENSEYAMQDKTIEVGAAQDDPEPQEEEIRLSRLHYMIGDVTSREMTVSYTHLDVYKRQPLYL